MNGNCKHLNCDVVIRQLVLAELTIRNGCWEDINDGDPSPIGYEFNCLDCGKYDFFTNPPAWLLKMMNKGATK